MPQLPPRRHAMQDGPLTVSTAHSPGAQMAATLRMT